MSNLPGDALRQVGFLYTNYGPAAMELFLAQPPACSTQWPGRIYYANLEPVGEFSSSGNRIFRYTLPRFSELRIGWECRLVEPNAAGRPADGLNSPQPGEYLATSGQLAAPEALRRLGAQLGQDQAPRPAAHAFFAYVVQSCRYRRGVPCRGAEAMLAQRHGDCGQFSCLFAALCRSVGIPARVVLGTLLGPVPSPHAWAEFWCEDSGWMPVDASLAQGFSTGRIRLPPGADRAEWRDGDRFFGHLTRAHFAFSLGVDVPLAGYGAAVRPLPLPVLASPRIRVAGSKLHWGYEAPEGAAPWLQPGYPRGSTGRGAALLCSCAAAGEWVSASAPLGRLRFRMALQQYFLLSAAAILMGGWLIGLRYPLAPWAAPAVVIALALESTGRLRWPRRWLRRRAQAPRAAA